jgi:hypothetical protein
MPANQPIKDRQELAQTVHGAVDRQPVVDMHTHLYPPAFGTPVVTKTGRASWRTKTSGR